MELVLLQHKVLLFRICILYIFVTAFFSASIYFVFFLKTCVKSPKFKLSFLACYKRTQFCQLLALGLCFCFGGYCWILLLLFRSGDVHKNPGPFRVLSLNVNSLWGLEKRNMFRALISSLDYPECLALQETKLDDTFLTNELMLGDYTIYRRDRNRFGGGVLIGVRKHLCATIGDINFDTEGVTVNIRLCGWSFDVVSFYRPSSSNKLSIFDLDAKLRSLSARGSGRRCLTVAGDFNMPDYLPTGELESMSVQTRSVIEVMQTNGLENVVMSPLRGNNFLDLVFVTKGVECTVTHIPAFSDHCGSVLSFDTLNISVENTSMSFRRWQHADWPRARKMVSDYAHSITISDDVDDLLSHIHTIHDRVLTQCVPVCQSKRRKWQAPWYIRREINLKMRLHKLYKSEVRTAEVLIELSRVRTNPGWFLLGRAHEYKLVYGIENRVIVALARVQWAFDNFKRQRSLVKNLICQHTVNELRQKAVDISAAPKRFWRYVNRFRKRESDIPTLSVGNMLYSNSYEKAEALGKAFSDVFVRELPMTGAPMFPITRVTSSISDMVFTNNGVRALLEKIDESKAEGPDGLSSKVLKHCATELAPMVATLFNASLASGVVPKEWRVARVIPVPKKGASCDPLDYRPISLTSVLCKQFEHVLVRHLFHYLDEYDLLITNQHGFRRGRSCETALVSTFQKWADPLDQNRTIDALLLDFSKAFDRVPHMRLLYKLEMLGITGNVLTWIKEFLSMRTFAVNVDNALSTYRVVASGVPQGTILGPVLFLCFVNDLPQGLSIHKNLYPDDCSGLTMYADDILLYRAIDIGPCANTLQIDLAIIVEWCKFWCLDLNVKKCCHLRLALIGTKPQPVFNYCIELEVIQRVETTKYLGVTVSDTFRWNPHITRIKSKACSVLGLLRRNFSKADVSTKLMLYKTLVRPIIEFGAPAWDPYFYRDINELEAVQNKAARFITNTYSFESSVTDLKRKLNLTSLAIRRRDARVKLLLNYFDRKVSLIDFPSEELPPWRYLLEFCSFRRKEGKNSFLPRTLNDLEISDLRIDYIPFDTG